MNTFITSIQGKLVLLFLFMSFQPLAFAQFPHEWSRSFGGSHPDHALDLGFDHGGNLYVTGYVQGALVLSDQGDTLNQGNVGNHEIILNKYNPEGELLWSRVWQSEGQDKATALAIDDGGNVYLTGNFENEINFGSEVNPLIFTPQGWGQDAFLLKVNPLGETQWARTMGGNFVDLGSGVAIGTEGNVIVCGRFLDSLHIQPAPVNYQVETDDDGRKIFMAAFNGDGELIWLNRVGETAGQAPKAMRTDNSGNIYLAGDFIGTISLNPAGGPFFTSQASDLYVAKYNPMGQYQWARAIGGPQWESLQDMNIAQNGDLAITGTFYGELYFGEEPGEHQVSHYNGSDVYVARLDNDGNTLWAHSAGGMDEDVPLAITFDLQGNVTISGSFKQDYTFSNDPENEVFNSTGFVDGFIAHYLADGTFGWARPLISFYNAYGQALTARDGFVALTGRFSGDVITDFSSETPNLFSLHNGTSMDAFVTVYRLCVESGISAEINMMENYLVAAEPNAEYQWFECNGNELTAIEDATNQEFSAPASGGNFAVQITLNGCNMLSDCIAAPVVTSVNNILKKEQIHFFPNPTTGLVNFVNPEPEVALLRVLELTGREVFTASLPGVSNTPIDLSQLVSGVYFVQLVIGESTHSSRLVVQ